MVYNMNRAFEMISALQKCVRRAMTEEAGYWFFNLCEMGQFGFAINRLKITAHEDIGVNDIQAVMFALRSIDDARELYKAKNDGWRVPASNAIIALCQANKGREADNFQAICRGRVIKNPNIEVPDFAFDKHTIKGRKMGRGFKHFFDEAAKLVPQHQNKWEAEARQYYESGLLTNNTTEPKPEKLFE
ncbi:MAG: hypothetical protein A2Y12_01275 [Planctomycetes bacterium GWF2_42_9]|nr:MAG: hypothetical protein A2Y12_01275 [Planctomycetes bacterium GWF2_42_9]HAL44809.1 hypothetical protein [Phycisphaerales bacterium]